MLNQHFPNPSNSTKHCRYCATPIAATKTMCASSACRQKHNQQITAARWARATPADRQLANQRMNAHKTPELFSQYGRIAGAASAEVRSKEAKALKKLEKQCIERINKRCSDPNFVVTSNGKIVPLDARNRQVAAGRKSAANNFNRLPRPQGAFRSPMEQQFYEVCVDNGIKISINEQCHQDTIKYLHFGTEVDWNPDFRIELDPSIYTPLPAEFHIFNRYILSIGTPEQRQAILSTGHSPYDLNKLEEFFPDRALEEPCNLGSHIYVETKGLYWIRYYERCFLDKRRKPSERRRYLRKLHKLVVRLYQRILINFTLSMAGLQPRVYFVNLTKDDIAYLKDGSFDLMTILRHQADDFFWDVQALMTRYFFQEQEMLGEVLNHSELDLSSESAALADIARKLDPEFSDVTAQTRLLNGLARSYFKGAPAGSWQLHEIIKAEQDKFNAKHQTNFNLIAA